MITFCLLIVVIGIVGLFASYKIGVWSIKKEIYYMKKGEDEKAHKHLTLTYITLVVACVSKLSMFSALIALPFIINNNEEQAEHSIITTIDKLIAGEEVPVQEMRSLLAAALYPSVEFWAKEKNIPEENKGYAIVTVSEAIRKATVKIELPPDFVSETTNEQQDKEK